MKKLTKILTVLIMVASLATSWAAPAEGSVAPNKKLYDFNFVNMDYEAIFRSVSVIAGNQTIKVSFMAWPRQQISPPIKKE